MDSMNNTNNLNSSYSQYHAFNVLIVDDEIGMQTVLKKALGTLFSKVDCAGSIEEAEILRLANHYEVIILDINLPGRSGIEWEAAFKQDGVYTDVIFITGYADLNTAISALKLGAADFILKPFNLEQIISSVKRCLDRRLQIRTTHALQRDLTKHHSHKIIGGSEKTKQLRQVITQFAASRAPVLIEGEAGTGKELTARALHHASERFGPFVAINCATISPSQLEKELFGVQGHEEYEGLFRLANNGTIFLDEINELALETQQSLLQVLKQRTIRPVGIDKEFSIDVRIIAATTTSLHSAVERGLFKNDLYYRLAVLKIDTFPLRDRIVDLREMFPYFTRQICSDLSMPLPAWLGEYHIEMHDYDWPGNVRELRNLIERCLLLNKSPCDYWKEALRMLNKGRTSVSVSVSSSQYIPDFQLHEMKTKTGSYPNNWSLKEVERAHIEQLVHFYEGNKSAAARSLGVSRKTLDRKYREWDSEEQSNV
jgi:DNA-binding NtrC family response regulator